MQQKIKSNMVKDIVVSITKFEEYEQFAIEQFKYTILYVLKLLLLFSLIISILCTIKFFSIFNNVSNEIEESIKNVEYKNGNLSINSNDFFEKKYFDFIPIHLIIDTSDIEETKKNKYINNVDNQENGIIILKNQCILKYNSLNGMKKYEYQELINDETKLNKDYIVSSIKGINLYLMCMLFFIIFFIIILIVYGINFIFYAVAFSLIGNLTSLILRVPLKNRAIFNIAIHSLTLPTLLHAINIAINVFTGFDMKYFQVMYIGVTYVYIVTATLMIKTDFINRKMELRKIIEEQEKIRREKMEELDKKPNEEEINKIKKEGKANKIEKRKEIKS